MCVNAVLYNANPPIAIEAARQCSLCTGYISTVILMPLCCTKYVLYPIEVFVTDVINFVFKVNIMYSNIVKNNLKYKRLL